MKSPLLGLLVAAAFGASAAPGHAGWDGFYAPATTIARATEPRREAQPQTRRLSAAQTQGVCIREILLAQLRHNIPDNILLGIGLQEAGTRQGGQLTVWPWAVNAAGEGRLFQSRAAALDWVGERQRAGVESIDVGCLQINLRWHPEAFSSVAQGFDPRVNVDYAARFLKSLYAKTGDWKVAAGSYHSFTPEKRAVYLASLERNVAVANDRIAGFRALAGSPAGAASGASRPNWRETSPAAPGTPDTPDTGPLWTAQISGGRRGIYSRSDLQPVLPAFRPAS